MKVKPAKSPPSSHPNPPRRPSLLPPSVKEKSSTLAGGNNYRGIPRVVPQKTPFRNNTEINSFYATKMKPKYIPWIKSLISHYIESKYESPKS